MKIVFKVDSSFSMGTGHVMRCLVLANTLRDLGHTATFICRELPGNIIATIKEKDFDVLPLPYDSKIQYTLSSLPLHQQWIGASKEKDLQQTLSYLSTIKKFDYLIVDHYGLDQSWENACRSYVKKIVVIDDLADRKHDCDLLLDQNYYINTANLYLNRVPKQCKLFIGPHYALLRPEFRETRQQLTSRTGIVKRLMVSLGGSDHMNITQKILHGIDYSNYRDLPVDVIMGATSQHKEAIKQWCDQRKNYHFHCPSHSMAEIMKNADLAIGAGGTTTWERCCLGLASLVVCIAANQKTLINQGLSANLFDSLGDVETLNEITIAEQLNKLILDSKKLQLLSLNGMQLVDGLGAHRVAKELESSIGC